MKKVAVLLLILAFSLVIIGCEAHVHYVGKGAQGGATVKARQWYVLFGLVPINNVDTRDLAGQAENYTIKTEKSFLDIVINVFTSTVSVYSRTVTVTK